MKHIKLFEDHISENEINDINQKLIDGRGAIDDLKASIADMGDEDEPNQIKIAIAQIKIQKQNLKNQILQLDSRLITLKDKLR